jgi:DNA-binding NtrC family response regulator
MRPITILIDENEPIIALDLRYQLERIEIQVLETCEAVTAESACERLRPDIAILNFKRSDHIDGFALAQILKRRFLLPVLIITGASQQEISASQHFDSALEILYKPYTNTQLRSSVQKCCASLKRLPDDL